MKSAKHEFRRIWHNNMVLIKLCFQTAPGYVVWFMAEKIRNALSVFLGFTIGFNYVLECAEFGKPFKDAAMFLGFLIIFSLLGFLFGAWLWQKIELKSLPKIKSKIKEQLYIKAKEMDLEFYDNPEFYNEYVLAVSESDKQIDRIFTLLDKLCSGITATVCASGFIMVKDPVSLIFIAVSFTSILLVSKHITKLNFKIRNEKIPLERKLNYVNRVFYLNDYAKEIRLNTELSKELLKDYDKTCNDILAIDKINARKRLLLNFFKDYICNSFISNTLYITYLVYQAVILRQISFSNVVVLHGTANRAKSRMNLIAEVYPLAQEISLYMDKIIIFLETTPKIISSGSLHMPESLTEIELKNISFKYSKNGGYILKNINMKIAPFSKTAIVGYNGAGKTTLIKLIMRLYDSDEGEILLNGVNIKEYNLEEYRSKIGAVFQDFKIFAATIKENVLLDFAEKGNDEDVFASLDKSGFSNKLKSLPNGINTNLTTEFEKDGINLSGGEGQKIAIARVFYSDANLIVLDEPSSALDPIAEYHINYSMMAAADNKSVLFISHRLSTTRIADRIYVLENGEIIEEGSHNELLSCKGIYAEMWRAQSMNYCTAISLINT